MFSSGNPRHYKNRSNTRVVMKQHCRKISPSYLKISQNSLKLFLRTGKILPNNKMLHFSRLFPYSCIYVFRLFDCTNNGKKSKNTSIKNWTLLLFYTLLRRPLFGNSKNRILKRFCIFISQ